MKQAAAMPAARIRVFMVLSGIEQRSTHDPTAARNPRSAPL
jgi:hypothetical protein